MIEVESKKSKVKVRVTVWKLTLSVLLLTFYFLLLTCSVVAQETPPDEAPPPLRTVTKEEKMQLDALTDVKNRTKLAIDLMTARLTQAERLNSTTDFDGMFKELGGFHGLLDNTLEFLGKQDSNKGKVLDNYKRLELGLRTFETRLETIRRELPSRYEEYVRKLLIYVRDSRSRAIDPMFGDTVLKIPKPGEHY